MRHTGLPYHLVYGVKPFSMSIRWSMKDGACIGKPLLAASGPRSLRAPTQSQALFALTALMLVVSLA